jgi:hypothetical protein
MGDFRISIKIWVRPPVTRVKPDTYVSNKAQDKAFLYIKKSCLVSVNRSTYIFGKIRNFILNKSSFKLKEQGLLLC